MYHIKKLKYPQNKSILIFKITKQSFYYCSAQKNMFYIVVRRCRATAPLCFLTKIKRLIGENKDFIGVAI